MEGYTIYIYTITLLCVQMKYIIINNEKKMKNFLCYPFDRINNNNNMSNWSNNIINKVSLWQRHNKNQKHIFVKVVAKDLPPSMVFCNIIAVIRMVDAHCVHMFVNAVKHFSRKITLCYINVNI